MSQQQHTQEPWRVAIGDDYYIEADGIPEKYPHHFKCDDLGKHVAIVGHRACDFGEANARRIVACVNACAGLDTELLENIVDLGDSLRSRFESFKNVELDITDQRDTLLEAYKQTSALGRFCLSEDDCIVAGIDFSAYERGLSDAIEAFGMLFSAAIAREKEQA